MDLKHKSHTFLHVIDTRNRLSTSAFVQMKNKETIVKAIYRTCIAVYGSLDRWRIWK